MMQHSASIDHHERDSRARLQLLSREIATSDQLNRRRPMPDGELEQHCTLLSRRLSDISTPDLEELISLVLRGQYPSITFDSIRKAQHSDEWKDRVARRSAALRPAQRHRPGIPGRMLAEDAAWMARMDRWERHGCPEDVSADMAAAPPCPGEVDAFLAAMASAARQVDLWMRYGRTPYGPLGRLLEDRPWAAERLQQAAASARAGAA